MWSDKVVWGDGHKKWSDKEVVGSNPLTNIIYESLTFVYKK